MRKWFSRFILVISKLFENNKEEIFLQQKHVRKYTAIVTVRFRFKIVDKNQITQIAKKLIKKQYVQSKFNT